MNALRAAKQHGSLVRWDGGYWTTPNQTKPATHPDVIVAPLDYVRPEEIKSLLYLGQLAITEFHPAGFPVRVVPAHKGRPL